MSADADRNLLFGVLALQAGLLDARQFAEACSAWAGRRETPLADLLVERGLLTGADRALVDSLVERAVGRHAGDAGATLAVGAGADARRTLTGLGARGLAPPGGPARPPAAGPPDGRGRYTLSRPHARGGVGQVWVARDEAIGREVALKELLPERVDHAAVRARFLEEARITGQLEHPGIVPVYELVQAGEGGRPFYTMRLVKGRTLADAIRAYHARRDANEAGPLELRELLAAFVAVCNAVAYAHSRGVLHRDLKPSNVVLGDYGEVVVLDWGLAKARGQGDTQASLPPVSLEAEADRGETVQGQVLGTPPYMAPEQAEGRVDRVGEWSDVYGLGAVLYELLTGRPPFTGPDAAAVLAQVVAAPPVPPRARVARTPRGLEAVCLKALAKDPAGRYATAKDLAQDIRRWLADEPVSALRDPLVVRLRRWERRYWWLVPRLSLGLALTYIVLVTVLLVLIDGQRQEFRRQVEPLKARAGYADAKYQGLLAKVGSAPQAAPALAAVMDRPESLPPDGAYDMAGLFARWAKAERDPARSAAHADRAVELLHAAVAGGFKDAGRLRADPALDPLRQRDDFKEHLEEVERKARGKR
jgi:serine/threonine-protein kinase